MRYLCAPFFVSGVDYTITHLPALPLDIHDQLRREGPWNHEVFLVQVPIRWRRQGINRHEDSFRAVERAENFLAELRARGKVAIGPIETPACCLWLLL